MKQGEEATFENTTQVPFATSTTTFGNVNNTVNSNTQIDFIDVGTILRVTPRITSFDTISMTIDAEDSTFVEVEIFANGEINTLPQKTQNRAQTQVSVVDRETIVLGGLRTSNNINTQYSVKRSQLISQARLDASWQQSVNEPIERLYETAIEIIEGPPDAYYSTCFKSLN